MGEKFLILAIFVVSVSIAFNSFITAKNTQTLSIKPQMEELLRRQEAIENKLSSIESSIIKARSPFAAVDKAQMPPGEDFDKEYKINIGRSYIKGNKDAKVTIVEFSDFQCPFSKRFHSVINEALNAYPKDVKFIFKNFPLNFHPQARSAAKATFAAGAQGKYWEMVDLLFQNNEGLSEEKYKQLAGQLGLNVEKFMQDYKERDAEWEKIIAEDLAAVDACEARGTPTFYINGKKTMARDLAGFKAEVDKILQK